MCLTAETKIKLREKLTDEIFYTQKFPKLRYAYVCEYHIEVASYTGFHLKCRIANASQEKLAVSSNTAQS